MTPLSGNSATPTELVESVGEVSRMPKVRFLPMDIEVEVPEGTAVLDAALNNNIQIDHNCGGNCACSTCHIIIEKGFDTLNPVTEDEMDMLDEAEGLTDHSRLACQCKVKSDLIVKIPPKESTWENDTF